MLYYIGIKNDNGIKSFDDQDEFIKELKETIKECNENGNNVFEIIVIASHDPSIPKE